MTKDEFREAVGLIPNLVSGDVDRITEALHPLLSPVDIVGKTVVLQIPMSGKLSDEDLNRCYAYADWIRKFGAKNVLFLPLGSWLSMMTFDPLDIAVLRFDGDPPEPEVLDKYVDWIRIAREGTERIVVLGKNVTLEKMTDAELEKLGLRRI